MDDRDSIITQTLEVPKKESKEGVFATYLELRLTAAQVMKDINHNATDIRINDIVDWMISGIPSKSFQDTLRERRDERIKTETKDILINEERAAKIQQINREIAGEIAPYMDMYTGGERINRISFVIPIKEMRQAMQNANPDHFAEHLDGE